MLPVCLVPELHHSACWLAQGEGCTFVFKIVFSPFCNIFLLIWLQFLIDFRSNFSIKIAVALTWAVNLIMLFVKWRKAGLVMIPEVNPFTCSQQHLAGQCIKCVGKYLLGESDHATNVCCRWIVFCFSTLQLQTVNHTHNWYECIIQLSAKRGEKKDVPFRKESVVNILVSHQCFGFHIP